MKKILALISLCLGLYFNNFSQSIDVNWSSMRNYENKKDGFFDQYIGANSKYVYAKFHKMAWKPNKANSKIKIVAYDKKTMEISSSKAIIGYKENEGSKDKYQGLEFYKGIPVENSVYLFWYKKLKGNYELYAEVLDSKLNEKIKLKKVYEVINKGKKWDPNLFVVGNEKASENIVIGAELPRDKGQNIKFEYKVLKSDLSFEAANQITLPYSTESKSGLTSDYELGDNGFLYIKTNIRMDKDERANLKKHESPNYSNLAVLNLSTGKLSTNAFKFDDKNLFYLDYLVTPNSVKVFAFFCDLLKDPKGRDSHGIFYGEIDNATNSMTKTNFTYFDKETLTKLFEKDKKDNHKSGIFSSKKSKKSDDESLADDYVIEEVQSLDKDNIVLFCSRMNNWSTTTCDSKGNCTTHYCCTKSNVTTIKMDNNGKILWSNNLDREITYSGWNVYDLKVVNKADKLYVIYGSAFQINAKKKNRRSAKGKNQRTDRLEYAVFNYKDGAFKRDEYKLNAINAKKKDRKTISPSDITVLDNTMYVDYSRVSIKPLPVIFGCLGGLICPPVIAIPFLSGNARKGYGYLGTITPLK